MCFRVVHLYTINVMNFQLYIQQILNNHSVSLSDQLEGALFEDHLYSALCVDSPPTPSVHKPSHPHLPLPYGYTPHNICLCHWIQVSFSCTEKYKTILYT